MEQSLIANQELFNAINNADAVVQQVYKLKNEVENLRAQARKELNIAQFKRKKLKKDCFLIPLLISVPAFVIFAIALETFLDWSFFTDATTKLWKFSVNIIGPMGPLCAIVVIWAIVSLPMAFLSVFISKFIPCERKYIEKAKLYESMATEKYRELERFIWENKDYVAIIAPEFRYPVATQELARIFRLGRAATLPEAYDKLELKLHQMRVEEKLDLIIAGQRAVISLLSKIEYNTRWLDYRSDYDYDYDDF